MLSGKCACMADLAVDDEDGGELDEAQIVVALVLPAGEQAAEAVEPAVPDLDDPAPRWVALRSAGRRQRGLRARLGRDVRGDPPAGCRLSAGVVIVAPV